MPAAPREIRGKMLTLRVIAGWLKGFPLKVAETPTLRPTQGRVREAVFNIWQARIEGAVVLDAFAGSGMMGLEALSRGAARVIGIERNPAAVRNTQQQLAELASRRRPLAPKLAQFELRIGQTEEVILELVREGVQIDLAFIDPPYASRELPAFLKLFFDIELLAPGGEALIECTLDALKRLPAPEDLRVGLTRREHRYGDTVLVRYQLPVEAARAADTMAAS